MYALNIDKDSKRILSACIALETTSKNMPRVLVLPEGDINDYKYVDSHYVYDPLPAPPEPEPEPTQLDRIAAQVMWTALMTDTFLEV